MLKKISTILFLIGLPMIAFAQSVSEIVQEARSSVQEINSIAIEVDSLLQSAQGSGDSVLLQCISTKQASISALQDISEIAMGNLQATSEISKANYELRKITLSLSKVRQFGSEASKCSAGGSGGGSEDGDGGSGTSEVSVDQTGVTTTITEGSSVEGGTSYSFDSTTSSTSSDTTMSTAETTSPGGNFDEDIETPNEPSPF